MLPTVYQDMIFKSRYARYNEDLARRESWPETVDRYISFFKEELKRRKIDGSKIPWQHLRDAIFDLEIMPSMRCLMTAGEALERDNVSGYNCSYVPIDRLNSFDEMMYILMCGTGVGFSVERQYISKLPEVPSEFIATPSEVVLFSDSKIGWARGYKEYLHVLFQGRIPRWDTSRIRPKGSPLKTFGGRASGPEPLEDLLRFTESTIRRASGRHLSSIECHDLVCKIADIVVCGGVRRSALISLSNLTDERMRHAKSGEWWKENPQRALSNNSVCYTEKPDVGIFLREWSSLYESRSGERGIFNRAACTAGLKRLGRRDTGYDFGTNPCSEIILRPRQFCNLSECVARPSDTVAHLREKIRLVTALGTLQSLLTAFRYIGKEWVANTEDERLLGVSITGIYDNDHLSDIHNPGLRSTLGRLRDESVATNVAFAKMLGIPESTAITCIKPSGTVSQLTNSASGIHPRYARHYLRRIRMDVTDPLCAFMESRGLSSELDGLNSSAKIFTFPVEAPAGCVTRDDVWALDQLKLWEWYADYYCEHKPSITVYVRENEWLDVGAWVYRNFDKVSGVSFLPYDAGSYRQAPYEEIDAKRYKEELAKMPKSIDFEELAENEDATLASKELACTSGICEL